VSRRASPGETAPLAPPRAVVRIAERLEEAGFETWCVGGAVRDALLGHAHLDWDLATAATPDRIQRLFRRTIPVGVRFGTVGVLDDHGTMHEVTTFRRDVRTDGRHAEVEFGVSLDDDLARRDYTINAIAWSPRRAVLHDPFDGRADLERGVVRAVGAPRDRMREDRLRALRALRFAARFGFSIEPRTWDAIVESAPHLGRLSRERVKQELEKTMEQVERPSEALRLWRESGALHSLIPSLDAQPDLAFATIDCVRPPSGTFADRRLARRMAALVIGLPADQVRALTRDLRFANAEVSWLTAMAERWALLGEPMLAALSSGAQVSDATLRRWAATSGRTRMAELLRLAVARWSAAQRADVRAGARTSIWSLYRRALRIAWRDPIETGDLAIDGEDLQHAGVAPGPQIGQILRMLLELVVEDPARNTRELLMARASELVRELPADRGR
jgi:tRNA nucleotidyltransferase (CCA-adding enzyme)